MADRPGGPRGVDSVHAQRRLAQIHRNARSDARRDQQHLTLAVRARQYPLHRVRRRSEVDRRDLPAPERLPLDLDRGLQEILPQQPRAVRDQQLSRSLGRQPAPRPRPDCLSEVIEARSKARVPLTRSITT
jgi:hypothetical protein